MKIHVKTLLEFSRDYSISIVIFAEVSESVMVLHKTANVKRLSNNEDLTFRRRTNLILFHKPVSPVGQTLLAVRLSAIAWDLAASTFSRRTS